MTSEVRLGIENAAAVDMNSAQQRVTVNDTRYTGSAVADRQTADAISNSCETQPLHHTVEHQPTDPQLCTHSLSRQQHTTVTRSLMNECLLISYIDHAPHSDTATTKTQQLTPPPPRYESTVTGQNLTQYTHAHACTHAHTHNNHFTALWTLSGTTWVSWYQKVHFAIFWIFWCKMYITQCNVTPQIINS